MAGGGAKKEREEAPSARSTLTAVLLADSFTQRFRPITVERPKVLLPLVNVPMLEYTLEWLAMNKVQETFVVCCAHADQVKAYLADSKWAGAGVGARQMKVTCIVSTTCTSAGEALRMVDNRDVIKSDFVLVSGDTVSNMRLAPVLEAHRARREKDKNAIMTMVMKAVHHPQQRLRLGDAETLICMDPYTKRLLKYQDTEAGGRSSPMVKIDAAFFSERDNIQIRTDLMDTHISICAPEVLMLFSDNFDYQNVKRDFVSGVLSEEELGNKLYIHELSNEYAAHVHNLRSYDAISRDILQRWVFPFVPDTNVLQPRAGAWGLPTYRYARRHVYCEQGVQAARSARLESDVCVGAATVIGEGCYIAQSVIGRQCRIGKNVKIIGSYIQDNVTIQDDAVLRCALVCENALVRPRAAVEPGAIVSFGVVIGQGHRVAANKRVSLCQQINRGANLSDDELEYSASGPQLASSVAAAKADAARGGSGGGARPESTAARGRARAGGDSDSDQEEEDSEDGGEYEGAGRQLGQSMEKPSEAAIRAAAALASGRPLEASAHAVKFDEAVVGPGGAGFEWRPNEGFDVERYSIAVPDIAKMRLVEGDAEAAGEVGAGGANRGDGGEEEGSGQSDSDSGEEDEAEGDAEVYFKREVSATVLRAVKERIDVENVKLELNGLKIAQDKTFADCARYIFTTLLSLGLPASAAGLGHEHRSEFAGLFPKDAPSTSTQEGKQALLSSFKRQLSKWGVLLQQFLRNNDDQLELLLTFEDYCSQEGVFKTGGDHGAPYAEIFVNVLQELYDADVLSEEALLEWAEQKEQDEEEDQVYFKKSAKFIEWLRNAEEDDDDDDEEDDEDEDEE